MPGKQLRICLEMSFKKDRHRVTPVPQSLHFGKVIMYKFINSFQNLVIIDFVNHFFDMFLVFFVTHSYPSRPLCIERTSKFLVINNTTNFVLFQEKYEHLF